MLKVLVNGCLGKMGVVLSKCVIEDEELELVCGVSQNPPCNTPFKIYPRCSDVKDVSRCNNRFFSSFSFR